MTEQQLTPWFPGRVKPVRIGVYQRDYSGPGLGHAGPIYCMWDGTHWLWPARGVNAAASHYDSSIHQRTLPWRGLAEEPKA